MCLTTAWVSAEEAAQWGLIYKTVQPEQLDAAVKEVVDQLAALPPLSLKYTKRAINFLLRHAGFEEVEDYGQEVRTRLQTTEDRREVLLALSEKRVPIFKGR
jgi:2-(1,2-epoxy-1,2-dihydrophenyl)acetyl-CoA isomerase